MLKVGDRYHGKLLKSVEHHKYFDVYTFEGVPSIQATTLLENHSYMDAMVLKELEVRLASRR